MNEEIIFIILPVRHLVLAERHISHRHVKKIVRVVRLFKAGDLNIGFRVKLLRNPPGDPIQFHAVQPALLHILRQHTEEIADTHCRLQYISFFKPHMFQGFIDTADNHGACVMGI